MGLPLDPSPWRGSAPASHGCRPPLPDGWRLHSLQQGRFPLLPALPPMAPHVAVTMETPLGRALSMLNDMLQRAPP
ncbi:hypothetical protein ZEAMMB73_Zm00001d003452 [Zea mays]|uniref:Uncharacterized protein n=1 Tax=Zea mays TaxID=4577 RepID=B6T2F6_MAIZE|nr:hypothetical protein [Zea mays]ACG42344.1 hypothetical protein [Zea mays]ONM16983.1 hypothetical protein ZEAMMB73_Zm00001d003452 [Zea mays]ONM16984.1 hypothetical protein ZEAMMB73_Zm00001d003452 [Zea mays]